MILVTGSAGYIGSHICHYLDRLGIGYYSIDNLSRGSKKNISKNFTKMDIGNSKKVFNIILKKKNWYSNTCGGIFFSGRIGKKKRNLYTKQCL